jgi:hypothetical protein
MVEIFLGVYSVLLLLVVAVLIWLVYDRFKLKKELNLLTDAVNRNNRDISGLCSAAITMDTRMTEGAEQLNAAIQKINELQRVDSTAQPYYSVIQKIRAGATVADLMQNSGLSRDEAVLLIRLHGSPQSNK